MVNMKLLVCIFILFAHASCRECDGEEEDPSSYDDYQDLDTTNHIDGKDNPRPIDDCMENSTLSVYIPTFHTLIMATMKATNRTFLEFNCSEILSFANQSSQFFQPPTTSDLLKETEKLSRKLDVIDIHLKDESKPIPEMRYNLDIILKETEEVSKKLDVIDIHLKDESKPIPEMRDNLDIILKETEKISKKLDAIDIYLKDESKPIPEMRDNLDIILKETEEISEKLDVIDIRMKDESKLLPEMRDNLDIMLKDRRRTEEIMDKIYAEGQEKDRRDHG
eukprot:TRINITY_DN682_c0_g1_i3.p1 TRINITY_DN682_c0_g1~~TRINITY_DN682_c0_g1_i3.p1  ORF type:complete len:279 (-),score=55.36 TRINITY_DN682_c0_g1_i3:28-864(-)